MEYYVRIRHSQQFYDTVAAPARLRRKLPYVSLLLFPPMISVFGSMLRPAGLTRFLAPTIVCCRCCCFAPRRIAYRLIPSRRNWSVGSPQTAGEPSRNQPTARLHVPPLAPRFRVIGGMQSQRGRQGLEPKRTQSREAADSPPTNPPGSPLHIYPIACCSRPARNPHFDLSLAVPLSVPLVLAPHLFVVGRIYCIRAEGARNGTFLERKNKDAEHPFRHLTSSCRQPYFLRWL